MKFLAIFIFLSAIILPSISLIHTRYEIKQVKQEMKKKLLSHLDEKETIEFKFSKSEFYLNQFLSYFPEDNEIEYFGKMYDIKNISIQGDSVLCHCISDDQESQLKIQLKTTLYNFFSGHHPIKQTTQSIINFLSTLFFQEIELPLVHKFPKQVQSYIWRLTFDYCSDCLSKIAKPPERH